jgi:phospholipase C
MGYYRSSEVLIADFFAREFTICDKWFAPLPASTQPNGLMAESGESDFDLPEFENQGTCLPYSCIELHRTSSMLEAGLVECQQGYGL